VAEVTGSSVTRVGGAWAVGPFRPAAAPVEARLCRGDPEHDTEPLPYADVTDGTDGTDGTDQLVQALNTLPTTFVDGPMRALAEWVTRFGDDLVEAQERMRMVHA
jgi:hypothetical protein